MTIIKYIYFHVLFSTESESPKVICPANQTEVTEPGQPTAMVVWEPPNVNSEAAEIAIDVETCHPKSGRNFEIGQTKVVCESKNVDQHDENICHFYISVLGKHYTVGVYRQYICNCMC